MVAVKLYGDRPSVNHFTICVGNTKPEGLLY